jgi:hypothetical protein
MFENAYRKPTASKNGQEQIYFRSRLTSTDNTLLLEARGEVSAVWCSVLQYTVFEIALKPGSKWHRV